MRPATPVGAAPALGLLCAAFFMVVLDSTSIFTALPLIGADLAMTPTALAWVVAVYGVVVAGFLLPFGRMADILGRRRVFLAAVAVFGLGSLGCGLATSGAVLIAARAVQAIGAAALTPAALALLLALYPEGPRRNRALGVWGGLGGIGATAGLLLGGLVTDRLGWSWIFLINIPVCLLVVLLTPRWLPESKKLGHRRLDLVGGALVSAALMLLVLGLLAVPVSGWAPRVWLPLTFSAAIAAAVVVVERRSTDPILPARLFQSRALVVGNIVVVASGICVDGLLTLTTVYAQQVLGLTSLAFGLILAAMTLSSVLAVAYGQRMVTRHGLRSVAPVGLAMLAIACASFTALPADDAGVPLLIGGLLVFGVGMGAAFVAGQIGAVSDIDPDDAGAASGLEETSFMIGSTLGVVIVTAVAATVAGTTGADSPPQIEGLRAAFATLAVIAAAGAVAASVAFPKTTSAV
ncbi:MFS transporter [Mumia sp. Pv 4-285]|uniref:MFS transporter n=1 Tax=Mumia qirimensis TaxID=3234852 RepID=UPI00351CC14E